MTLVNYRPDTRFSTGLNPLFRDAFSTIFGQETADSRWTPRAEVRETPDAFLIEAELAGLSRKDVNITIKNGVLTLTGERPEAKRAEGEHVLMSDRASGAFEKRFRLGRGIATDRVKAQFKNGLLTITLPKAEEAKPREIEVK